MDGANNMAHNIKAGEVLICNGFANKISYYKVVKANAKSVVIREIDSVDGDFAKHSANVTKSVKEADEGQCYVMVTKFYSAKPING